jgi:hypothetical protein
VQRGTYRTLARRNITPKYLALCSRGRTFALVQAGFFWASDFKMVLLCLERKYRR